ncbi:MAG: hypothetical protein AAF399_18435 [Bacteroidota bacterium]
MQPEFTSFFSWSLLSPLLSWSFALPRRLRDCSFRIWKQLLPQIRPQGDPSHLTYFY